jgi:DNA-binding NarL/FixJ family response regulator
LFTDSLTRLLDAEASITVRGAAATVAGGLDLVAATSPQVVLIDYQLPDGDGVALARLIKEREPATMVVMLTGSADDRVLLAAIDAGCSGFLTKDRAASEVVAAVHAAAAGEALISPAQLARLLPRLGAPAPATVGSTLTERERQVLDLMAQGLATRAIADELHLSVNTIRNYSQSILTQLHAHSKLEAVATAVREGIIRYPPTT